MLGLYNMEDLINQNFICRRPRFSAGNIVYIEMATCLLHFVILFILCSNLVLVNKIFKLVSVISLQIFTFHI